MATIQPVWQCTDDWRHIRRYDAISQGSRENAGPDRVNKCTMSVKNRPKVLLHFFPNGWEFLDQILHTYYTFLHTLD